MHARICICRRTVSSGKHTDEANSPDAAPMPRVPAVLGLLTKAEGQFKVELEFCQVGRLLLECYQFWQMTKHSPVCCAAVQARRMSRCTGIDPDRGWAGPDIGVEEILFEQVV